MLIDNEVDLPETDANSEGREYTTGPKATLLVTNFVLRISLLAVLAFAGFELFIIRDLVHESSTRKIPVIKLWSNGMAEFVSNADYNYLPGPREMQWWLERWAHGHYARLKPTLRRDFLDSLAMTGDPRHDQLEKTLERTRWIDQFLVSNEQEVDVHMGGFWLPKQPKSPYRAVIQLDRSFLQDGNQVATTTIFVTVTFTVDATGLKEKHPERLINNPLGFQIYQWVEAPGFTPVF